MSHIRAAAIQFCPELGEVDHNLQRAAELVREAFRQRAHYVVLPEFFSTGMSFDDKLLRGHRPLCGAPLQMLQELAVEGNATVGGSFLAEADGHVYNSFALATGDGRFVAHDKDFPSGPIEHAYYAGGEDDVFVSLLADAQIPTDGRAIPPRPSNNVDGIAKHEDISMGMAICWELIRRRTAHRLADKVDVVLAGSAWPTIDPEVGFPGLTKDEILGVNAALSGILADAPVNLARCLGVPVVHANLVGDILASKLFDQPAEFVTQFAGESRIVDAEGNVLASLPRSQGEGVIVADVELAKRPAQIGHSEGLWLLDLPAELQDLWYQGALGRGYYLDVAVPHRDESLRESS